ncbi:lysine--tRNA ligase [bacterium]|nr:lysine--tRNA ligase [bacterium]
MAGESLVQHRLQKLLELQKRGINPYREEKYPRTHLAEEVKGNFPYLEGQTARIAGRVMAIRRHGRSTFLDLQDSSGKIQVLLRQDKVGEERYELLEFLDIGDILGVSGQVIKTRTGEITVEAEEFVFLAKALQPFPEKWHGLKEPELRYRFRYLDLIVNERTREIFYKRARIIQGIREFFIQEGFIEVDTPMMQPIPGGASARPFITHHNALDMDLYLRIAPELYLKRLLVGGMEKIFELGRCFRNEGISTRHNPEFTLLEAYIAYGNLDDIRELTESLLFYLAKNVLGGEEIEFKGNKISLKPPFQRVSLSEAIKRETGIEWDEVKDVEEAKGVARSLGVDAEADRTKGEVFLKIFEKLVEPRLIQPTFVEDFPIEVSPLAKRRQDNPSLTRRFELFIGGEEIANAFSELNDPIDQRERFKEQMKRREMGDEEAQRMDEDFLLALEYGMPPAGGLGIGVDRLVMLFTDSPSIREVILFPLLRPREED